MPVVKRYNWSGYYGCAGDKALIPVLVKDHMELGAFDFRTKKTTLLDRDEGGVPPVLSPNGQYALWTEKDMTGRIEGIGPRIRVYKIASNKRTELLLPKLDLKPGEGAGWHLAGFSEDGSFAIFEVWAADNSPRVKLDLEKAEIVSVNRNGVAPN
jgi:hypothetical protein